MTDLGGAASTQPPTMEPLGPDSFNLKHHSSEKRPQWDSVSPPLLWQTLDPSRKWTGYSATQYKPQNHLEQTITFPHQIKVTKISPAIHQLTNATVALFATLSINVQNQGICSDFYITNS